MAEGSPKSITDSSEGGCVAWLKGPTAAIYAAYFLSSWGDRMWHFGVGIYLVFFDGGALQLAAVYGFISCGCILLFGGILGDWVDRNRRIKVVRVSLFIQNLTVALSAAGVGALLRLNLSTVGYAYHLLEAAVISLSLIAVLSSCAYKIAIEKDWIVEVASGNRDKLARLNAVSRTVNLACKALSPLLVGQIMTYGSRFAGAMFMACWNIVSVIVEYALLRRVYKLVPSLANKIGVDSPIPDRRTEAEERDPKAEAEKLVTRAEKQLPHQNTNVNDELEQAEKQTLQDPEKTSKRHEEKTSVVRIIFTPCIRLYTGWSVYMRQHILLTGLSLACLYMTVLGFDSITIGYIYSQGVTESVLGICCGLAAITGIIGSFLYTQLQKYFGLYGTGIISFSVEVTFLLLSLISIWTPGSPFYLYDASTINCTFSTSRASDLVVNLTTHPDPIIVDIGIINETESRYRRHLMDYSATQGDSDVSMSKFLQHYYTMDTESGLIQTTLNRVIRDVSANSSIYLLQNISVDIPPSTDLPPQNGSVHHPSYTVLGNESSTFTNKSNSCDPETRQQTSVILFLIGIVASRIGLWMADLTITQLYQEEVAEHERGAVGGVQTSLNMLLDMLKFVAVILLPKIHTFGFLVIMSFCFIIIGLLLFTIHVLRETKCKKEQRESQPQNNGEHQVNIIYKPKQTPKGMAITT